jgi:hypothetical protein
LIESFSILDTSAFAKAMADRRFSMLDARFGLPTRRRRVNNVFGGETGEKRRRKYLQFQDKLIIDKAR